MQVSVVAADGLESLGRQMATLIGRSPGNGATLYSVKHYRDSEPGLFVNDEKNIAVVFLGPSAPANDVAQVLPQSFYGYGVDCRRGGRRATIIANPKDDHHPWHVTMGYGPTVKSGLEGLSQRTSNERMKYQWDKQKDPVVFLRDEMRHNTEKALEEISWLDADPKSVAASLLFDTPGPVRPANLLRRALQDQDIMRDDSGLVYWGPKKIYLGPKKNEPPLFVDIRVAYGYGVARFLAQELDAFTSSSSSR